jgi:hypothetical protein
MSGTSDDPGAQCETFAASGKQRRMNRVRIGGHLGFALMVGLLGCGRSEAPPASAAAATSQATAVLPPPPRPAPSFFRDHYERLEDCVYDWGYAQKCVPVPSGSPAHQAGARFFGPTYARDYREETQLQLRREALAGGYAQDVPFEASDRSAAKSEVKP